MTKMRPLHLVFRNPRFFRVATYRVRVENVGAIADGPARVDLPIEVVNPRCWEPWVYPDHGYLVTLDPGQKTTRKFMVVFWPCRRTSPPVDYRVTGVVFAPGDTNPGNDSIEGTVNVLKRRGHPWWWGWW